MALPVIVLVGGFLGAGKTSLIISAARTCRRRGMRVAAIMNDQDHGLVDTRLVEANHLNNREIAGGCFCCRFSGLLDAAQALSAYRPDVIFAEPVGSCIDLSATVVRPLQACHQSSYLVAPLTVLFDPALAARVYGGDADRDLEYLFRNQIDEADIVCATKSDLQAAPAALPVPLDFSLSSRSGEGVEAWLNHVLTGGRVAGSQLLKVDYARYAEAEAALGWLNIHVHLRLRVPTGPALIVGPLLERIEYRMTAAGLPVAHLKVFDRTEAGYLKASICANGSPPETEGDLLADPSQHHDLAINLRALAEPDLLTRIVSAALGEIAGTLEILHQRSFRPAPPKPQHRFSSAV
jgi:hypothetical protein